MIGRIILKNRINKNLKLTQLAHLARIQPSSLSYIERGLRNPSRDTLVQLALALELEWDYFLLIKDELEQSA